jgi:hypothetical protein
MTTKRGKGGKSAIGATTTSGFRKAMKSVDYGEMKRQRREHRRQQLGKLGPASAVRRVTLTPEQERALIERSR